MASGYGSEIWCTDTLKTGRYARRAMVLAQALFRRVITPRGMLRAESTTASAADEARIYGIDLAGMVGQVAYVDLPEFVASTLRAEFLKDDRVLSADPTVSTEQGSDGMVAMTIDVIVVPVDETEDFRMTMTVAQAQTQLVSVQEIP